MPLMTPADGPIFTAKTLTRRFGSVEALRGLNVEAPGRAIGLLGPNGAGKSTFLKILIGLLAPSSGEARILGLDARRQRLQIRSRIGYVPEDECSFPHMEGIVGVAYAAQLSGLGFADALKRSHELLDFVGLGEERYREVDTYSTGMKQLLKVAQALVHDPELLVLDEPTNGVDPDNRDNLIALIEELINGGLKIIVSSHLLSDVEALCDGAVIVDHGRVIESGSIEDLRSRGQAQLRCEPAVAFEEADTSALTAFEDALRRAGFTVTRDARSLELRPPEGVDGSTVTRIAAEQGVGLRRLELERDSLQDVFLSALERNRVADDAPIESAGAAG